MKIIRYSVIIVFIFVVIMAAPAVFAQQAPASSDQAKETVQNAATPSGEISLYGEVKTVNSSAGSMAIQYYDYDSDSEMTAEIVLGAQSKVENVSGIKDIKEGDWVDVIYEKANGKNIAKIVRVEKDEPEPVPADANIETYEDEEY